MLMDITGIDLFDQNMSMVCAKVRLRYSWISPILIYLIKLWVWYVPKLDSDAAWISLVLIYLIKISSMVYAKVRLSYAHGYHWF